MWSSLPPGCEQKAGIDPDDCIVPLSGVGANGVGWEGVVPTLEDEEGAYHFEDFPDFKPTLSPQTVLSLGSFGGGYFRTIHSKVNNVDYQNVWKELPAEWLKSINVETHVASPTYNKQINKYKQNCGAKAGKKDPFGLDYWETKHWIAAQDPYGWFHWYTRFFCGRRSMDDRRQIDRWKKVCGERGRWKMNLIGKVLAKGASFDDYAVSPVVRQTLQHWAYALTRGDFKKGSKRVKERGAAYIPKDQLKHVMNQQKRTKDGVGGGSRNSSTSKRQKTRKGVVSMLLKD
jgi:hypothetical protein